MGEIVRQLSFKPMNDSTFDEQFGQIMPEGHPLLWIAIKEMTDVRNVTLAKPSKYPRRSRRL